MVSGSIACDPCPPRVHGTPPCLKKMYPILPDKATGFWTGFQTATTLRSNLKRKGDKMKNTQERSKINIFMNAWVDFWKAGVSLWLPEKKKRAPIPGIDVPIPVPRPSIDRLPNSHEEAFGSETNREL
jgi:hypothetical protein